MTNNEAIAILQGILDGSHLRDLILATKNDLWLDPNIHLTRCLEVANQALKGEK